METRAPEIAKHFSLFNQLIAYHSCSEDNRYSPLIEKYQSTKDYSVIETEFKQIKHTVTIENMATAVTLQKISLLQLSLNFTLLACESIRHAVEEIKPDMIQTIIQREKNIIDIKNEIEKKLGEAKHIMRDAKLSPDILKHDRENFERETQKISQSIITTQNDLTLFLVTEIKTVDQTGILTDYLPDQVTNIVIDYFNVNLNQAKNYLNYVRLTEHIYQYFFMANADLKTRIKAINSFFSYLKYNDQYEKINNALKLYDNASAIYFQSKAKLEAQAAQMIYGVESQPHLKDNVYKCYYEVELVSLFLMKKIIIDDTNVVYKNYYSWQKNENLDAPLSSEYKKEMRENILLISISTKMLMAKNKDQYWQEENKLNNTNEQKLINKYTLVEFDKIKYDFKIADKFFYEAIHMTTACLAEKSLKYRFYGVEKNTKEATEEEKKNLKLLRDIEEKEATFLVLLHKLQGCNHILNDKSCSLLIIDFRYAFSSLQIARNNIKNYIEDEKVVSSKNKIPHVFIVELVKYLSLEDQVINKLSSVKIEKIKMSKNIDWREGELREEFLKSYLPLLSLQSKKKYLVDKIEKNDSRFFLKATGRKYTNLVEELNTCLDLKEIDKKIHECNKKFIEIYNLLIKVERTRCEIMQFGLYAMSESGVQRLKDQEIKIDGNAVVLCIEKERCLGFYRVNNSAFDDNRIVVSGCGFHLLQSKPENISNTNEIYLYLGRDNFLSYSVKKDNYTIENVIYKDKKNIKSTDSEETKKEKEEYFEKNFLMEEDFFLVKNMLENSVGQEVFYLFDHNLDSKNKETLMKVFKIIEGRGHVNEMVDVVEVIDLKIKKDMQIILRTDKNDQSWDCIMYELIKRANFYLQRQRNPSRSSSRGAFSPRPKKSNSSSHSSDSHSRSSSPQKRNSIEDKKIDEIEKLKNRPLPPLPVSPRNAQSPQPPARILSPTPGATQPLPPPSLPPDTSSFVLSSLPKPKPISVRLQSPPPPPILSPSARVALSQAISKQPESIQQPNSLPRQNSIQSLSKNLVANQNFLKNITQTPESQKQKNQNGINFKVNT